MKRRAAYLLALVTAAWLGQVLPFGLAQALAADTSCEDGASTCVFDRYFVGLCRPDPKIAAGTRETTCQYASPGELDVAWRRANEPSGWLLAEGLALLAMLGCGTVVVLRWSSRHRWAKAEWVSALAVGGAVIGAATAIAISGRLEAPSPPVWRAMVAVRPTELLSSENCKYVGLGAPILPYGSRTSRAAPMPIVSATVTDGSPALFATIGVWDHTPGAVPVLVTLDAETLEIIWHFGACGLFHRTFAPSGDSALVLVGNGLDVIDGNGFPTSSWRLRDGVEFSHHEQGRAVFEAFRPDGSVEREAIIDPRDASYRERPPMGGAIRDELDPCLSPQHLGWKPPFSSRPAWSVVAEEDYEFRLECYQVQAFRGAEFIWKRPYQRVFHLHEFFYAFDAYQDALYRIDPSTGEPLAELSERSLARLSAGSEPNPEYEPGDQP